MNYDSYLIPDSIKESCNNYINRLQKENAVYSNALSRVNGFLLDKSSSGEVITALKERITNYSSILASLILANEYDIEDANDFINKVGDEIYVGEVILKAKEEAESDARRYGSEASSCYSKAMQSTSVEEANSWWGKGNEWSGMANSAWGTYDFFHNKELKYDEINESTSALFQRSKTLRESVDNLLKLLNSGKDLDEYSIDYAMYRQNLRAEYISANKEYNSNKLDSDTNKNEVFWNSPEKETPSGPNAEKQLDELNSKKEAYQKALDSTEDPHQKNIFAAMIAELDRNIKAVREGVFNQTEEKIFVKTTYTGKTVAALYEEKAALEKAIEADPFQRHYLETRIKMLEDNIQDIVDYGLDSAKHKEFRFVYDKMGESTYSEEEKLKVYSYFMSVDTKENLQGKEMPKWWMDEYLNGPYEFEVNEGNVVDYSSVPEMSSALYKYYEDTYFLCDCISGMGNQKNGDVPLTGEEVREMYLTGYQSELYSCWFDYVYGGMYDYAQNIGSVRANKYALENYMDFPDQTAEYGVYKTYSNIENDYYRFCKDAYLYKYDHADEYYNYILNKDDKTKDVFKYLNTSDNVDERLFFYLKGDVNRTDKSFTLEEQKLIKDNYRAHKNGEIMQSKNLYDMAAQLQEDQSVYALGDYTVRVEGQKIIINARIIKPTGYLDTKYDSFVLDFSDCCSSAFGSLYISNEVFAEKMFEYSKYRYENGWIDSEVTSLREDQVEEVINSDEFNRSIAQNIENYNELSEAEKNLIKDEYRKYLYIMADCQDEIMSIYESDRTTKIEKANKEWDQDLLALSLMTLMAVPFSPTMAGVGGAALSYINGAKQCLQGNYYEGGTEIVLTTAAIAAPFVLEQVRNAKAVRALKNADEILDVSDNLDDAERLAKNVEELKNVPDNEIDCYKLMSEDDLKRYQQWNFENEAGFHNNHPGMSSSEYFKWQYADSKVQEFEALSKVDYDEVLQIEKDYQLKLNKLYEVEKTETYLKGIVDSNGNINPEKMRQLRLAIQKGEFSKEEIGIISKKISALGITEQYEAEMKNIKFGEYLRNTIGNPPEDMIDPHAHHILFKTGLGEKQQELVKEGQAILRKYGIDPITGTENIVWAPNGVPGQHDFEALQKVVGGLRELDEFNASRKKVELFLRKMGMIASSR